MGVVIQLMGAPDVAATMSHLRLASSAGPVVKDRKTIAFGPLPVRG